MKYLNHKKSTLSILLMTTLFSSQLLAYESEPTKTIKGYYPSFNSVGTKVIRGDANNLKPGDIIAIPSDLNDARFFDLFDRDLDPALKPGSGKKYDVVWWKVKPKDGYKWSDDNESDGENVSNWNHIETEMISKSTYLNLPEISTSPVLRIPPVLEGQRIAFSITPETEYGDPSKGVALFAPDLNFFWGNTDPDQTPGEPDPDETNPETPPTDGGGNPGETNPDGGGGPIETIKVGTPIVHIYIDKDGDGKLDVGVDQLLEDNPTVDTTYLADIQIATEENGELIFRSLTPQEEESITWNIINGTEKVSYSYNDGTGRVSANHAFTTQKTNDDANDVMKSLPDHFSEQGTVITVSFSFDGETTQE